MFGEPAIGGSCYNFLLFTLKSDELVSFQGRVFELLALLVFSRQAHSINIVHCAHCRPEPA